MKMADLPSTVVHRIKDDRDADDPALDKPAPGVRADLILETLKLRRLTPEQLAEAIGLDMKAMTPHLGRLVKDGRVYCCDKVDRDPPPPRGPRKIKVYTAR
jgi:hypothetical protein